MFFLFSTNVTCLCLAHNVFAAEINIDVGGNTRTPGFSEPVKPIKKGISPSIPPQVAKRIIKKLSDQVIACFKKKDFKSFSNYVDPGKGVRFSECGPADRDVVLTKTQLPDVLKDKQNRIWGGLPSGEDINLTFADFYSKYLYSKDFSTAPDRRFNDFIPMGATENTIYSYYPNSIAVEYFYLSSFGEAKDALADRKSLTMVFEKSHDSKWCVVDIIYDFYMP